MGLEFILAEPGSATRIFWDELKQNSQAKQSPQTQKTVGGQTPQARPVASAAQNSGQNPARTTGQATGQATGQTPAQTPAQAYGTAYAQTQGQPPVQANNVAERSSKQAKTAPQAQAPSPHHALGQTEKTFSPSHTPLALLDNLPQPWSTFAAKSKAGRPLLWTYQELGLDLLGRGNANRSNIIKKIITTLKLPAGSSNFWPHSVPEQTPQGQEFKQEPSFFEQGFNALEPQFLLVFGKPSAEAIIPNINCLPYSYTHYNNKVLIYLPGLEELEDNQKLRKSVEFLQIFTLPCFGGGS